MLGGTLALLTRNLRADAMLLRSHLIRLLFVSMIFFCLVWAQVTGLGFGAPGRHFLNPIIVLNFILISLAGVSFFATAITEEKEEGTLGLLKMAGISRAGILLGKSTNRVIAASLLLSCQFPFTLLAITLGGVTYGQVIAAYAALAAYLVLTANLGLFCSVYCRRSGNASGLTACLLLLLLAGPPVIRWSLAGLSATGAASMPQEFQVADSVLATIESASVHYRLQLIMHSGFDGSAISTQVVSNLIAAGMLFVLAWATFDIFTREGSSGPAKGKWLFKSLTAEKRKVGTRPTWSNPLAWKDFYFTAGGTSFLVAKFVIFGVSILGIGYSHYQSRYVGRLPVSGWLQIPWNAIGESIMVVMVIAIAIELSVYASCVFHDELKWKTHTVMSMLPLSTSRMAYSKVAGCLLALTPALVYFCLGAVINPGFLATAVASPEVWSLATAFIVFLHLTALLSLIVRWGALPLASAIMVVFIGCFISPMSILPMLLLQAMTGTDQAMIAPILYLGGTMTAILQMLIGRQLKIAAMD